MASIHVDWDESEIRLFGTWGLSCPVTPVIPDLCTTSLDGGVLLDTLSQSDLQYSTTRKIPSSILLQYSPSSSNHVQIETMAKTALIKLNGDFHVCYLAKKSLCDSC